MSMGPINNNQPGAAIATPGLDPDLDRLTRLSASRDARGVEEVARKLEGVFFTMMVKQMRESLSEKGLFGDGPGSDTYNGFFDDMMGDSLSQSGDLGIAEMVVRQAMDRESGKVITLEELKESQRVAQETPKS